MTITNTPVDNGVNTEALLGAREALTNAPEAAEFTWRSTCSWVRGTHTRSTVEGFSGLGQDHNHKTRFVFDADAPAEEIKALVAQSQKRSAVFDMITNPSNVTVTVA